jgi:hypothetical protein
MIDHLLLLAKLIIPARWKKLEGNFQGTFVEMFAVNCYTKVD